MKSIRIALLATALVAGAATVSAAQAAPQQQGQGQPGARGGRGGMAGMRGIELTDEQKTKMEEITKKYAPERTALMESMQNGGDRAELMTKMRALQEKMTPEVRAILTADQQAQFDKNVAEQKARMEQQRQAPPTI